MAATSGRTRNRHGTPRYSARPGAPGPVAEHRSKIIAVLAGGVAAIVLVLSMTSEGHAIDAATQRFMLFYAGVFALIGLTASVAVGLVATDRVILTPGHRVMAQAVHRAVSFGAMTFLLVHIVTEILAQRVHAIDAVVPFLSPFRTFYIGLGTIASDLILLIVITSIIRKRFTAHGKAWRWRAIHYTSYASYVFGVLHGLLGGRSAKPYVDWSYGFAIALVALGLVVRYLAISLRPKENLSVPPAKAGGSTSPLRAATLGLAQAQLGATVQVLPAGLGAGAASRVQIGSSYASGIMPLGAPAYGDDPAYGPNAVASLPAASAESRQPLYEPGYVGPPRYEGAPRGGTGPMPRVATGPMPRVTDSGPVPPVPDSGPLPRANTGPIPRASTGPIPRVNTGPMPRAATGPLPRIADSGPMPRLADSGPIPRVATGPMPHANTGPMPRAATGPIPRVDTGPRPGGGSRRSGQHPADPYLADRYPEDCYPEERHREEPYRDQPYREDPYRENPYRTEPYPAGQQGPGPSQHYGPGQARGDGQRARRPEPGRARHRGQDPSDPSQRDPSQRYPRQRYPRQGDPRNGGDAWR